MMHLEQSVYTDLKQLIALQQLATGFSFLPRQPIHSVLSGRHASRLRGRGLNFEELRHYRIGDDIRTMDWKVTQRTRKPHVRVYTEERERPVLLLVDQRIGMFFGSQVKMKSVIAAELAALSAWRVLDVGDRVGAIIFGDAELTEIKPQRSHKTVMRLLQQVHDYNHKLHAQYPLQQNNSQLNVALKQAERLCGHDYLLVLISDMSGWDTASVKSLKRLSRHNDMITAMVFDPLENELPQQVSQVFSDGVWQIQVKADKTDLHQRYNEQFNNRLQLIQAELKQLQIPVLAINTIKPVVQQIRHILGEHMAASKP